MLEEKRDAVNGVQATKAGGMAALGVGHADDEGALAEAGADLGVTSLDGVALNALVGGHLEPAGIR
jgi:beta-phosphoglucomutase